MVRIENINKYLMLVPLPPAVEINLVALCESIAGIDIGLQPSAFEELAFALDTQV